MKFGLNMYSVEELESKICSVCGIAKENSNDRRRQYET